MQDLWSMPCFRVPARYAQEVKLAGERLTPHFPYCPNDLKTLDSQMVIFEKPATYSSYGISTVSGGLSVFMWLEYGVASQPWAHFWAFASLSQGVFRRSSRCLDVDSRIISLCRVIFFPSFDEFDEFGFL